MVFKLGQAWRHELDDDLSLLRIETGRFTIPEFGAFVVRETAKRTALNPRTGEKVPVKAGATVKFKASPALKEAALAGLKKAKRKAAKG